MNLISHIINCLCIIDIFLSYLLPNVHFTHHPDLKLHYWGTLPCKNSVGSETFSTISCEIGTVFRLKSRTLIRGECEVGIWLIVHLRKEEKP